MPNASASPPSLHEIFFDDDAQVFVDESDPELRTWHLFHSAIATPALVAEAFGHLPSDAYFGGVAVNDIDDAVDLIWLSRR